MQLTTDGQGVRERGAGVDGGGESEGVGRKAEGERGGETEKVGGGEAEVGCEEWEKTGADLPRPR